MINWKLLSSEKPELGERILITLEAKRNGIRVVDAAIRTSNGIEPFMCGLQYWNVIAWAPLPEPMK